MKTKFSIIILLAVAAMIACTKTPTPDPEPTPTPPKDTTAVEDSSYLGLDPQIIDIPHYIIEFYKPQKFSALVADNGVIYIYCSDVNYGNTSTCGYYDIDPNNENPEIERIEKYAALCERYGDITYDNERTFVEYYNGGYSYPSDNIVSIDVVSETNYDAEHPAGSSLNDICVLEAESPYKHIQSGYTLTHNWPMASVWQPDKGSIPFSKQLTECTAEDMILMGDGWNTLCKLRFTKKPTPGKTQLITITLTDETGKVYTVTTEPFTW